MSGIGVMLIDMQSGFLKDFSELGVWSLVYEQSRVLNWAGARDVPVVCAEYLNEGDTHPSLRNKLRGVPRVLRITKEDDDIFTATGLVSWLDERNVADLFFMGVNAHACVLDSARTAYNRGYAISTAESVIGRKEGLDRHTLGEYQRLGRAYKRTGEFFREKDKILSPALS
jgi:nicotinamidase-related amidase